MNNIFNNKVIAITGGSEGIGKAMIHQLIKAGAKISTCGRNQDKLYNLHLQFPTSFLHTVVADISRKDDCSQFIESTIAVYGHIDILINNAGISMRAEVNDTDLTTLEKVMNTNFWGTVYCTKFALASIIENKGIIVGISSIAGYRGLPGRSGYSASKHAVHGWLEALRTELLDSGVHVMWVCPGFTSSNIRNAALNAKAEPQAESPLKEDTLMSAEKCANYIIKAIKKRKRNLVLTFNGKRTVFLNKFFPEWTDKLVRKFFYKKGQLVK